MLVRTRRMVRAKAKRRDEELGLHHAPPLPFDLLEPAPDLTPGRSDQAVINETLRMMSAASETTWCARMLVGNHPHLQPWRLQPATKTFTIEMP